VAQVHAINSDKAVKAIKQAIACHGFCGSEVPWKIKLTGWPTCRGQGLLLKAKAKDLTFKAKDSKFVLEDTSRPRTKAKDNNTGVLLVAGPMAWNSLPDFIRDPTSHTDCFKQWRRNCGDRGVHCTPKFRTCTPCTLQVKDAACVKILNKQL